MISVIERRKEKEQHKILKQQEKIRIQEQLRKEREMRAQQIIEVLFGQLIGACSLFTCNISDMCPTLV